MKASYIKRACEIVTDHESDHPEVYYAEDDIRILTSFQDECLADVYHVFLMTDHVYDVQFHSDEYAILEVYASCSFQRFENQNET